MSAAISVSSRLYRFGGGGTIRPDVVQPEVRYARTADGVNIAYQVRGEGPVAKERMKARREAWDKGAWVREAAVVHEQKRKERKAA